MAVPQQSLLAPGLPEKPDERQARLGQQGVFKRVVNLRHPSATVIGHGILGVDVDRYKQPAQTSAIWLSQLCHTRSDRRKALNKLPQSHSLRTAAQSHSFLLSPPSSSAADIGSAQQRATSVTTGPVLLGVTSLVAIGILLRSLADSFHLSLALFSLASAEGEGFPASASHRVRFLPGRRETQWT